MTCVDFLKLLNCVCTLAVMEACTSVEITVTVVAERVAKFSFFS